MDLSNLRLYDFRNFAEFDVTLKKVLMSFMGIMLKERPTP